MTSLTWFPELNTFVRYKSTGRGPFQVHGTDQTDRTVLLADNEGLEGWISLDRLEPADDAFTNQSIEQSERDEERYQAGYAAGVTAERERQTELYTELRKHQDLVEALQFLPAGTVVDFCDRDDFLEEMRGRPTRWLPRRECKHSKFEYDGFEYRCTRCGVAKYDLGLPTNTETVHT